MTRVLKGSEAHNPPSDSQLVPGPSHGFSNGLSVAGISLVFLPSLYYCPQGAWDHSKAIQSYSALGWCEGDKAKVRGQ